MNPPVPDLLRAALTSALGSVGVARDASEVHVERTARPEHGDFFTNVAMVAAKTARRPPRELAAELAAAVEKDPPVHVERVEVAGPGFLNFHLGHGWLRDALRRVIDGGVDGYARPDLGHGERVQIEFVSANPTGPLHVGNGWLCSYGDTLARLMARCGWQVSREYYVNDTGGQIRRLGGSLLARVRGEEVPEEGYQGAYVAELAQRYPGATTTGSAPGGEPSAGDNDNDNDNGNDGDSDGDSDGEAAAGRWAADEILGNIRASLRRLGIAYDEWFSQASIEEGGAVDETLALLSDRGLVFEEEGATWLRTTALGDVRDRVLVKSNGDVTYLGGDIAYHRNKFLVRGFDRVIDVFGADHHGQVASLKAAVAALGVDPARLEIHLGQMVSLVDGKMSKRAGNFVSLDDLLDDIGPDAFRLLSLTKSINESTTLDLELVRRQSMDNPVYYVQYAHARIASISKVRAERGVERVPVEEADFSLLVHPREVELIRCLDELPDTIVDACTAREPFKVVTWARKLADRFHGFYHDCYVLGEGIAPELTQARLWLVEGARLGLVVCLDLVGVAAPESM